MFTSLVFHDVIKETRQDAGRQREHSDWSEDKYRATQRAKEQRKDNTTDERDREIGLEMD